MEEAKFSFNVKFNLDGFDCQFTVRTDTTGTECVDLATRAITVLTSKGAVPDRRWEAAKNGNNKPIQKPVTTPSDDLFTPVKQTRLCPICSESDQLALISTRYGRRFKCNRCNKWLPAHLQPTDEELADIDSGN